jgi:CRP-like cAMP-binding protein
MTVGKIPAPQFRKAAAKSDAVRNMCIQYNEVLLSQARVTAACNALHVIEARFCRWLLQSADRAESDTVALTQEFLAEMLGVRRTSVTEVASKMQAAGAINYSRGQITILNRSALEKMSCECYQTLVDQSAILI